MQFSETDDVVDIRYDNVFKAVFTRNTPESQGALSKLVSTLIKREVSILNITANEPPIENLRDRQIRFDINCKAESGEPINVEMCLNPSPFEPARLEFYASKLFIGQDIRGKDKSFDNLKESYQIAILAKRHFFADDYIFHTFEYYDKENNISLNGKSRIITVELSKLGKVIEKPVEEMSPAEHWAVFFEYLTDKAKREKINQIIECQEGIAMASEAVAAFTKEEIEYYHQISKEKYEMDIQCMETLARRKVREELKEEFKEAMEKRSHELRQELRKELGQELRKEFGQELRQELRQELGQELRQEAKQEVIELLEQGLSVDEIKKRLNQEKDN